MQIALPCVLENDLYSGDISMNPAAADLLFYLFRQAISVYL
jgi:hypothetical protein